jgi:thioesterase domain-containing protein
MWHTVAGLAGYGPAGRVDVETLRGLAPREMALAMIRGIELPQLLGEARVDDVLALTRVRAANLRAQLAYQPGPYPGHLTYFSTTSTTAGGVSGLEYWSALAQGGCTEHPVGGSHGTILSEPYVHTLAEAILAEAWRTS